VARIDNLEFLSDVIPRTTTFKEYKEKKSRLIEPLPNGQTTLSTSRSLPRRPAGINGFDDSSEINNGTGPGDASRDGNGNLRSLPSMRDGNGVSIIRGNPQQEDREDVEMG
jgi:hypothetical protein